MQDKQLFIIVFELRHILAKISAKNYNKEGLGLGDKNKLEEKIEVLRSELYDFCVWDKNMRLCCVSYAKSMELDRLIVRYMKNRHK